MFSQVLYDETVDCGKTYTIRALHSLPPHCGSSLLIRIYFQSTIEIHSQIV